MWTAINVSIRPIWDLLEYRVVATWNNLDGEAPVQIVKEGTLDGGSDTTVPQMLQHVVERLVQESAIPDPR